MGRSSVAYKKNLYEDSTNEPDPGNHQVKSDLRLEWVAVVRNGSSGFTILALGAIAVPLVDTVTTLSLGNCFLIVACIGGAVAGARSGKSRWRTVQGMVSALASYLLFLPVVVFGILGHSNVPLEGGALVAVAAGAALGRLRGSTPNSSKHRR